MNDETTSSAAYKERYSRALMNTFGEPKLVLDHGEGVYAWDREGKQYLDLLGGIAVNALGYAHPSYVAAITRQAGKLAHTSNFFATVPQIELAEKIVEIFATEGYEENVKVYFANSGAEANEAALKLARLHKPGGKVLALTHSFHGRTLGALSLTEKPAIREPFEPLPGPVAFVEPTKEALTAAFGPDVAAIFVEPIQGEAGVVPIPDDILRMARKLADTYDALLVVDEVQTGMGRTGRWLESAKAVRADVVTLAKGLGGGMPIGACVAAGQTAELFTPGSHGSTYAGNAIACAAALATLTEVSALLDHVRSTGEWLTHELEAHGFTVRGAGLLRGIVVEDSATIAQKLLDRGIIVNAPNPTTIRIAPPLIIDKTHLTPFIEALVEETGC
ncbi:acetylornithine transaminase [Arcanobacterium haemolyticum]|nr:acetylornithine transaminase [Arcanobacterium haemolyticum]